MQPINEKAVTFTYTVNFVTFRTKHVSSGSRFLERAQMTLHAVQCHLDIQGASALIVHLVIKSANTAKIFHEVIHSGFCVYFYIVKQNIILIIGIGQ